MANLLSKTYYTQLALAPSLSWIPGKAPATPKLSPRLDRDGFLYVDWSGSNDVRFWAVQVKSGKRWQSPTLSAAQRKGMRWKASDGIPDAIAVTAIDRFGRASRPMVIQRQ